MYVSFEDWTDGRRIASFGTNAGAAELPFQTWRNFKEAYAPELVAQAVRDSRIPVTRCLDPFGGSGTTALACQFLGIHPTVCEVNPFLADLIEAKLSQYDTDFLASDLGRIAGIVSRSKKCCLNQLDYLPPTFIEPGVNERWIFSRSLASRIANFLVAINSLDNQAHQRLFRVLMGECLIEVSNILISGKGRRYRRNWQQRELQPEDFDNKFYEAAQRAIKDIHVYAKRSETKYRIVRGDSRRTISRFKGWDLAVFSPPYPNSFDYTDVYNVELWVLGYLRAFSENKTLRKNTLSSHVQVARKFASAPAGSPLLDSVLSNLNVSKAALWDRRIPEMVGGYFSDLLGILSRIQPKLTKGGSAWLVVGNSQYAGIQIETAKILGELSTHTGWKIRKIEPFRSMRLSPQQGGNPALAESLIVLDT